MSPETGLTDLALAGPPLEEIDTTPRPDEGGIEIDLSHLDGIFAPDPVDGQGNLSSHSKYGANVGLKWHIAWGKASRGRATRKGNRRFHERADGV